MFNAGMYIQEHPKGRGGWERERAHARVSERRRKERDRSRGREGGREREMEGGKGRRASERESESTNNHTQAHTDTTTVDIYIYPSIHLSIHLYMQDPTPRMEYTRVTIISTANTLATGRIEAMIDVTMMRRATNLFTRRTWERERAREQESGR